MSFIILSSQRSGSTLLRKTLNQHDLLLCEGELFDVEARRDGYYADFVRKSGIGPVSGFLRRETHVFRFLDSFYAQSNLEIGFKLMYAQTRRVPYKFPCVLSYVLKRNIKVIHHMRLNLLKVLLSRANAKNTGRYHSDTHVKHEKFSLDTKSLCGKLQALKVERETWRRTLKQFNVLETTHEGLVANRQDVLEGVFNFLGTPFEDCPFPPMKKVTPSKICDILSNFKEVERTLMGTEYESFLDG